METGFSRGAESQIPKRKPFEKWQHLSKKSNVNQYAMQGLRLNLLQHSFEASASSLPHPATIHYCHWIKIINRK